MREPQQGCIFCKIIAGDIPAKKRYEDENFLAFSDINPQAPTHILVIPKSHIPSVDETLEAEAELLGRLLLVTRKVAREAGLAASGYRMVLNHGAHGGQTVHHIHVHLLGGKPMGWPPFPVP